MIRELVVFAALWMIAVSVGLWMDRKDAEDRRNIFRLADESKARKCPGMRRHWNGQGRLI